MKSIKHQSFDLLTSVDVLTTGLYQRLRIKDKSHSKSLLTISPQSFKLHVLKQNMPHIFRRNLKVCGYNLELTNPGMFCLKLTYLSGEFNSAEKVDMCLDNSQKNSSPNLKINGVVFNVADLEILIKNNGEYTST